MITRILIASTAAFALVAGVQTWRVERLKPQLHDAKQEIVALKDAVQIGRDDAKAQADQCTIRVAEARASAIRIERIYDRPIHVDPTGCVIRDIVGADELRQALQPNLPPTP